jgi:hypothetical protein
MTLNANLVNRRHGKCLVLWENDTPVQVAQGRLSPWRLGLMGILTKFAGQDSDEMQDMVEKRC